MLELDGDLLDNLFVEKFGGVKSIPEDRWPFKGSGSGGISRETLWRWRVGDSVPKESNFLDLAAALDVDPAVLLRLPAGITFLDFCELVSLVAWGGSWPATLTKFKFFRDVILGKSEWPPSTKILKRFKRDWYRHFFHHNASVRPSYYAAFLIKPGSGTKHRVWHFAWRDHGRPRWRPYGVVIARESGIHLYCFDGREATAVLNTDDCERFIVETWFGPNNAEFCLASIHDFTAEVFTGDGELIPKVRFSVDHFDDSRTPK